MTESGFTARCEACSKSYRVARADGRYRCKTCGGALTVGAPAVETAPAASATLEGARTCPKCGALSFGSSAYCGECGAALATGATVRSRAERVQRREATVEIERATKLLRLLRWMYWLSVAFGMAGALSLALVLQTPDIEVGTIAIGIGLEALAVVLGLCGALLTFHQPVLWSLINAGFATVSATLFLLQEFQADEHAVVFSVAAAFLGVWLLLLWLIVFAALKVHRLREAHPDLASVHRLSGTELLHARDGETKADAAERARRVQDRARQRAIRKAVLLSGTCVALIMLVSGGVYAGMRAEPLESYSARFLAAWNANDVREIGELCVATERESQTARLAKLARVRGWNRAWPQATLSEDSKDAAVHRTVTRYDLPEDEHVEVLWRLTPGAWRIDAIVLPAPSLQPILESFGAAWRSGQMARMLELYPEDEREGRARSVERLLERLEWPASREGLQTDGGRQLKSSIFEVTFVTGAGKKFDARFELDAEFRWWLSSLRTSAR